MSIAAVAPAVLSPVRERFPIAAPQTETTTCELSVVIVSWNAVGHLCACLRSLLVGGGLEGIAYPEVWVVDNASEDNSEARVRRDFPQVRVVATGENGGFARAANAGLRRAAGRFVLLLNPDTVVPRGSLAALIAALDNDPGAAIAAPLLLHAGGANLPQHNWRVSPIGAANYPGNWTEASRRSRFLISLTLAAGQLCALLRSIGREGRVCLPAPTPCARSAFWTTAFSCMARKPTGAAASGQRAGKRC